MVSRFSGRLPPLRRLSFLLTWTLLVGQLAPGGPAQACDPVIDQTAAIPARGATGVPRETLITFSPHQNDVATAVVRRTGEVLSLEAVPLEGLVLATAFRPRAPLPPNEEIELGDGRRFTTGAEPRAVPAAWTLTGSQLHRESEFGCMTNSCAGLETLEIRLKANTADPLPLFHLVPAGSTPDPMRPALAFVQGHRTADGSAQIFLNGSARLGKGDRFFVVPVSLDGTTGDRLGPVHFDDGGGCTIAAGVGGGGRISMLGLLAAFIWLRRRSRRGLGARPRG